MLFLSALLSASRPIFIVVRYLHLSSYVSMLLLLIWSVHASTLHQLLAHHHHLWVCYVDIHCICTIKQLFNILFYFVYYSPPLTLFLWIVFVTMLLLHTVIMWILCLILSHRLSFDWFLVFFMAFHTATINYFNLVNVCIAISYLYLSKLTVSSVYQNP